MTFKRARWILPALALLGMADAGYLTWEYYARADELIPCGFSGGCNIVLHSSFSTIAGIPLSLFGVIFYFSVLALSLYWILEHERAITILLLLTSVAFLASLYFVYLQAYVIGAWCQYCLLSAGVSTALWIASLFFFKNKNRFTAK